MSSFKAIWAAVPASWKQYLKLAASAYIGSSYGPGASKAAKGLWAVASKFLLG